MAGRGRGRCIDCGGVFNVIGVKRKRSESFNHAEFCSFSTLLYTYSPGEIPSVILKFVFVLKLWEVLINMVI